MGGGLGGGPGGGSAGGVRGHSCSYSRRVPRVGRVCGGPCRERAGDGTERVEAEVRAASPGARVARLDRDAIRRKGSLMALLSRFRDGEIDVLVGTQMIAKGHDFPRVTLVGVVSADVGLGLADFRASERTFQLLTQVSGRAGRGWGRGPSQTGHRPQLWALVSSRDSCNSCIRQLWPRVEARMMSASRRLVAMMPS